LAPIREPSLVTSAIAATLGVRESGGQPLLATLKDYLRDKRVLLLLDNFEQVLDAAPLIAELLAAAAQLKVLITSREALHLRGEKEMAVPPLALPPPLLLPLSRARERGSGGEGDLTQYAAVALFIERALDARNDFEVTNANAPAMAEICARLDGLPLAIELAAARLKLFPPEALLARLSSRLPVLTGGPRDLPARQQTIRNTIDWSYDLLNDDEQILFRRLGVFVGGCTIEAATEVLNFELRVMTEEADQLKTQNSELKTLEGLAALVDKSLLRQVDEPDGAVRFVMLETIREYALERLEASGEVELLRRQHAIRYLALGETEAADADPDDPAWMARHNREYDNLWSALAWSQTMAGDSEIALRFTHVLNELWYHRGVRREAIDALERALDHPLGLGRTVAHFQARQELAQLLALTGNYAAAQIQHEEALSLAQELGDTRQYAWTLERLGWLEREQGDSTTAWARLSESLAILRDLGDTASIAGTLNTLAGVAILEEDPERAEALLAESRAVGQGTAQDNFRMAWTLNHLGHVAQLRGAYDHAVQLHQESLSFFGANGDWSGAMHYHAYHDLGQTALGLGHLDEAARWLEQALARSRTLSDQAMQSWCLAGLGSVAALSGQPQRAAQLWGAAERLRQSIGCRSAPAARATYERAMAQARAQLGEEAFAAARAAGQAMPLEQAIADTLGEVD
jgi:predicted ATPase